MDSARDQALAKAVALDQDFAHTLADPHSAPHQLLALLQQYRAAADHALACDFLFARAHEVEVRLWNAHNRLNVRLRKQLTKLRKERSTKPVETRKTIKLYLEFLKDSQRFYRDYIQKLNASFGAIPDLERIARQVKTDSAQSPSRVAVSPQVEAAVVLSCHQTLIYLGDLFRYRAAERLDKEPDWGPAIGYYGLAASLRPCSGLAFHQQSVIAFEQGDYLRSTYFLYRSINVDEPHPNAIPNLELQFKKITNAWQKGDLVPKSSPQDPVASRKALVSWFIRFHSLSYNGQQYPGYDELEREVLSRTASEIKHQTLDGIFSKMAMINFCAQATAGKQFEAKPDQQKFMQSYFFFLRFNVKIFTVALETHAADFEEHIQQQTSPQTLTSKLTDLSRHLLPGLRLYSTWLLSNAHIVAARVGDQHIQHAMDRFWHVYAKTLSLMAMNFSFRELHEIPYQLEEDVDAFGLKPLDSDRSRKLWWDETNGCPKPKFNDEGLQPLDTDQEMLGRIRELLFDALLLAVDNDIPITFDGSQFVYQDPNASTEMPVGRLYQTSPTDTHMKEASKTTAQQKSPAQRRAAQVHREGTPSNSTVKNLNREAQLSQMVDDLVGPDEEDGRVSMAIADLTSGPSRVRSVDKGSFASIGHHGDAALRRASPGNFQVVQTPELRTSEAWQLPLSPTSVPVQRIQSVSSIWNDELLKNTSPATPLGNAQAGPSSFPTSAKGSKAHSRVNSTTSARSPFPQPDGLSSFEPTPNAYDNIGARGDRYQSFSGHYNGMQSPLLFGAGMSPWSTGPRQSLSNPTPPNGQGSQGG